MNFRRITKDKAREIMSLWENGPEFNTENEYAEFRQDMIEIFEKVSEENEGSYSLDFNFGLVMYDLLTKKYNFTLRQASDDGIWRFVSVCLVPDIVYIRWGMKEERFWKNPRRIWLKALWWYIHLSWQGNLEDTRKILTGNTSDEIVQLVERAGSGGYRTSLYRSIMKYYGAIEKGPGKAGLFRKIMKLNTAKCAVIEPMLIDGGEERYVKGLFEYFGY